MSVFSIAGLQLELETDDNLDLLCEEIRKVRRRFPWLQMVVLGELSAFGTDTKKAQPLPGDAENQFAAVAKETGLWLAPGSLYENDNGVIFNTTPIINPDGVVVARHRKIFPFLPYEEKVACGEEFTTFDIDGVGRFGVSICYDMWFPETTRSLVCAGAEVIIHPTLTNTVDRDVELAIARANAASNQCYFIDINSAGPLAFGRSIVAGPGGEIIHQAGTGREIITVDIDLDYLRRVRERGWQGLGQQLKSFRDNPVRYTAYGAGRNSPALNALGELKKSPKQE
ncbi:MAG: carbon-nitrogen hydrolase family protein [Alphaproteobacteria bacterium]|nr:carbon-nitrogen hydrolase family protein [Alphaproteobacteria bacterium]